MIDAKSIIDTLSLNPHPEGGHYAETYRSSEMLTHSSLPPRYTGDRSHSTAIYYLLSGQEFSRMHLLQSDELFHFYFGHPVEILLLSPSGESDLITLGTNLEEAQRPQQLVPKGVWQGARLKNPSSDSFALLGCTVAPGFDFADFSVINAEDLVEKYPDRADLIRQLSPS
jgi:hypothetical protein